MVITEETIQADTAPSTTPTRRPIRRGLAIGAAVVVVAGAAFVAAAQTDGPAPADELQQTRPQSRDEIVRDLVARGVVPAASLDDGTEIRGPGLAPVERSRDEIFRDLVARGVVPAATLDDGTEITGPAISP
jgi:hypothetical protein